MTEKKQAEEKPKKVEAGYKAEALAASKHFSGAERDFLAAYLEEDKTYTIKEAKDILAKNLKGAVK